ncbi:Complex I intermediate-associated protein 30, mitochondrial [Tyrophagus putrescentiae]|nr:Complex I intermediate-associated protein 30, mitochondrial [Tyrophagus putrescentiae]
MNIVRTVPRVLNRSFCPVTLQQRFLFEQTRSGSWEMEQKKKEMIRSKRTEVERLKKSVQDFKQELKWSWTRYKEAILLMMSSDNKRFIFKDNEVVKFWDFNQANNGKLSSYRLDYKKDKFNDINNWNTTCDSDYDLGYSSASLTVSPAGYALFSGYLDKTLPKDGKVVRAGYAYMGSLKSRQPFFLPETHHEFYQFTHVVLRVRGDGRRYFIAFDTSDRLDITWFDRYQYMLYTHGGPYWQYVKIPLSRFFFHYQGYLQDSQVRLEPDLIRSVGILVHDLFSGPFRLEIDYIGFVYDSQHNDIIEYETHYHEASSLKSYGSV